MPGRTSIIPLCKHVVAKVTLVPRSVNLTGKRDKVGHGEVTINSARIIAYVFFKGCTCNAVNIILSQYVSEILIYRLSVLARSIRAVSEMQGLSDEF